MQTTPKTSVLAPLQYVAGLLALIFSTLTLAAAPSTSLFDSRVWDTNSGLPHNWVSAIAQTKDGFLWVGTAQGLARFDGVRFVAFDLGSVISNSVPHVMALCAGQDGSLWIGTRSDGLLLWKNGKLRRYSTTDGLVSDAIRALVLSQDSLWVGTPRGASRFKDGQFTSFTKANGLEGESVRCLHVDNKGTVWFVGGLGTAQVHQFKSNVLSRVVVAEKVLRNSAARAIWVDRKGVLWLGFTSGMLIHDGKNMDKFFSKGDGLVDDVVSSFGEDHAGNLWIGTYGGLSRWFDGAFVREFNQTGVFFDQVNVITEDLEGNIWLGTKGGIYRVRQTMAITYAREHGLSHNNIMSICETQPGNFWLGTWGGGLNWMRDGAIDSFTHNLHGTSGLHSDFILGMAQHSDGNLWFGTDYGGGIFKMQFGTDGRPAFVQFNAQHGFSNTVIRVVRGDRKGQLWFGTQEGVVIYAAGKFTYSTPDDGLAGTAVRDIVEDSEGNHWVATLGGLSRFKNGQIRNFTKSTGLSDDDVRSVYCDESSKEIWIGTAAGGLNRLKAEGADSYHVTQYTSKEGLWSDGIFDIVDDAEGSFWMSCLKGIFSVSKSEFDDLDSGKIKKLHCRALEHRHNGTSIQCNGVAKPGALRAHDGRLLFATVKGVVMVDPNFNRTNPIAPPVVIEDVLVDKRPMAVQGSKFKVQRLAKASSTLNLPPGRGELEFRYTALSFQDPERMRFKYKLEGVDEDWVDAGTRRDARYNNIVPGTYNFRVIACNNDGLWNQTGANVRLTLEPHFWQTWWFYLSCAMAAGGLVAGGARYATKQRMQMKLRRLEQQHALEKERTRIARDMHDEIGARLTQISFLGSLAKRRLHNPAEAEKQIDTIAQTAREVVSALDEIVWTVDPRKDTLDNLVTFLCRYASTFFQETSIICEFDLPPEMPNCRLETDVRHNIFLAVKEALNNVLKHSGAGRVVLQMRLDAQRLDIVISDNGKGFDTQPKSERKLTARIGNGLGNMQQRLESIGGKYRMESAPGKGTHLYFSVALPKPGNH